LDASRHEREHELPQFLPDGRHFIYLRVSEDPNLTGIYAGSIDDPPERQSKQRIVETGFGATYLPSTDGKPGRLLTFRYGTVRIQPCDPIKLQLQGQPEIVAERVGSGYETPLFGVSQNVLVYRPAVPLARYQLTWLDTQGKHLGTVGDAYDDIAMPVLSPDG